MATKEDRQILLDHLNSRHVKGKHLTWSDRAPVARLMYIHRRVHQHYSWLQNHDHEDDHGGPLIAGTETRQPSGWHTGLKVVNRYGTG